MAAEMDRLNVIITCSARKSRAPLLGMAIRKYSSTSFDEKLAAWVEALTSTGAEDRLPASMLYQGDHWTNVRQFLLDVRAQSANVKVWVASAGCGLITTDTPIPPYAATFAVNEADSVARTAAERQLWWSGLSQAELVRFEPRTISALVKANPHAGLLVAASPEYMTAIAEDLREAIGEMMAPERSVLLCREGVRLNGLEEMQLNLSAEMSSVLGGALTSLNVRALRWIVGRLGVSFNRSDARVAIEELRAMCSPRITVSRTRSGDEEISIFIRTFLAANTQTSASATLKAFREAGLAAEQRRFHNLFRAVQQEGSLG